MLSDGEMVQRRNMRHTASDSAPLSVYFLIANGLRFFICAALHSIYTHALDTHRFAPPS